MDEKIQKMEKEFTQKLAKMAQKLEESENEKRELSAMLSALSSSNSSNKLMKIEHSADFWTHIQNNCTRNTGPFGADSIKCMIKTGKMTLNDTNPWGQTLLHIAATFGPYDLAHFLINNVLSYIISINSYTSNLQYLGC